MAYEPWSNWRIGARAWLSCALVLCIAGALLSAHMVLDRYIAPTSPDPDAIAYVAPLPPNGRTTPIRIALNLAEIPFDASQARLARLSALKRMAAERKAKDVADAKAVGSEAEATQDDAIGSAIHDARRGTEADDGAPSPRMKKIAGIDVMNVRFDLGGKRSLDTLELSKPMLLNGQAVGKAVIKIEGETKIFLRSDAVNLVIARAPTGTDINKLESLSEQFAFVSWQRLRETGIDVRYDPIYDRILVKSLSS